MPISEQGATPKHSLAAQQIGICIFEITYFSLLNITTQHLKILK